MYTKRAREEKKQLKRQKEAWTQIIDKYLADVEKKQNDGNNQTPPISKAPE